MDLLPHVYDTERKIRIMGEDGKVDLADINKPVGVVEYDEEGNETEVEKVQNDVTVGAYDVVLDSGPSYTTKREEAKESMREFIQSAPDVAPVIIDLFAKAQDWPLADEIGQRLELMAPPQIQKMLAQKKQEDGEPMPPPEPPSPEQQFQMAMAQAELENKQLTNAKLKTEIATTAQALQAGGGEQGDPLTPVKAQGEMQAQAIAADKGTLEVQILGLKVVEQELKNEILRADLEGKQIGVQQGQEAHGLKMAQGETGLANQQEQHHAGMVEQFAGLERGEEQHEMSKEAQAAKLEAMKRKPEPRQGA
jgi:hypothetical protein